MNNAPCESERILTVDEAADLSGVPAHVLRKLLAGGKMPRAYQEAVPLRRGSMFRLEWRVPEGDLEPALAAHEYYPRAEAHEQEIAREVLKRLEGEVLRVELAEALGVWASTITRLLSGERAAGSMVIARMRLKWPERWAEVAEELAGPEAAAPES